MITQIVKNQPLVIGALVEATICLATAFGFNLNEVQTTAIMTFSGAVITFLVWANVIPVAKLSKPPGRHEMSDSDQ